MGILDYCMSGINVKSKLAEWNLILILLCATVKIFTVWAKYVSIHVNLLDGWFESSKPGQEPGNQSRGTTDGGWQRKSEEEG